MNLDDVAVFHHVGAFDHLAFEVDFEGPYDIILLTNFLHHFDPETCRGLLRKCHRALVPGGQVAALEFVPKPDRVTPPDAASFALTMLATTPSGDAYTFPEYEQMLTDAGLVDAGYEGHSPLPPPHRHRQPSGSVNSRAWGFQEFRSCSSILITSPPDHFELRNSNFALARHPRRRWPFPNFSRPLRPRTVSSKFKIQNRQSPRKPPSPV